MNRFGLLSFGMRTILPIRKDDVNSCLSKLLFTARTINEPRSIIKNLKNSEVKPSGPGLLLQLKFFTACLSSSNVIFP